MPNYDYRCESGHRYEKREPFGSPAQQPCERCGKQARRVLTSPTIVFKGSGWYKTDSRGGRTSTPAPDHDSDDGDQKTAAKADTESKTEGKAKSKTEDNAKSKTEDNAKSKTTTKAASTGTTAAKSSASTNGASHSSPTKRGSD